MTKPLELNDFLLIDKKMDRTSSDQSLPSNGIHTDKDIAPIVMLFAGEACHEQYFSTAHGAFLSGMGQMQKILAFYN